VAFDEGLRSHSVTVYIDQSNGSKHAAQNHQSRDKPEGFPKTAKQLAQARAQDEDQTVSGMPVAIIV
jgi:hypothetical protein